MSRRVTKVHKSDRRRVRGHWGRAARLRQSRGSGSGQRKLHVRLSVASLHFVFPFFQHRGLKMVEIFGTLFSFLFIWDCYVLFENNLQTNLKACSQFIGHTNCKKLYVVKTERDKIEKITMNTRRFSVFLEKIS